MFLESAIMWSERYRPLTLDNLVIDSGIIRRLKIFVEQKNIPHLLFVGSPGSGKLTTALCLIRDMYGHTYKSYYEEIDTQDSAIFYENFKNKWFQLAKEEKARSGKSGSPSSRQILRSLVRNFPKIRSFGTIGFRILIINNSHLLSIDTQQALRRMMEKAAKTSRLILLSNNESNIIDPIQSRCFKISFSAFDNKKVIQVLRYIAEQEHLKISDEALKAILFYTNNDLTKCINLIQSCASINSSISGDLVYNVIDIFSPDRILNQILNDIINQDFIEARKNIRDLFLRFGYMGKNILSILFKKILYLPIHETLKIQISRKIGEIDYRLVEGDNQEIQISYFLAYLFSLFKEYKEN